MTILRRIWGLVAVTAMLLMLAPHASGQPRLEAKLVGFPMWTSPDGILRVDVDVTNSGDEAAEGLRISISIHEGVTTRSQLELTFRGRLGPTIGGDTIPVEGSIAPGETRRITVEKPLTEIALFRSNAPDRAYPVRITVRAQDTISDPLDVHMVHASSQYPTPLGMVLAVPLHHRPIHRAGGAMTSAVDGLVEQIEHGRLHNILSAIEAQPEAHVTLAPTGLLVENLADIADGYQIGTGTAARSVTPNEPGPTAAAGALQRLSALASRPTSTVIVAPYSAASLTTLHRIFPARAQTQVGATRAQLEAHVGPAEGDWLLPTPPIMDEPTIAALKNSGIRNFILQSRSVDTASTSLTQQASRQLDTRGGTAGLIVTDPGLDLRIDPERRLGPIESRQRFFAETLTIMLERPALPRAVAATVPTDWAPDPVFLQGVMTSLAFSPWMRGISPQAALEIDDSPAETEPVSSDDAQDLIEDLPRASYFEVLIDARRAVDRYSDIDPPKPLLAALEKQLLISESSDWWRSSALRDAGRAVARGVVEAVDAEFDKINAPAPLTITLTSREGVIPLAITSGVTYSVQVVIRVESDKLRFPGATRCPQGRGTCITRRLEPRVQTIEVPTVTDVTGTFPLLVTLQTPNRAVVLDRARLTVRSTAYNLFAVAITAGAGIFLISWWIAGAVRSRVRG